MDYFVDTYLDSDVCLFQRQMWNHYDTEGIRTINLLEGWHAALNRSINRYKPNIYVLIKELKNQQQNFEIEILAQRNGNPKPKSNPKYRKLEKRLQNAKKR